MAVEVEGPDKRPEPQAAFGRGHVDGRKVATTPLDDLEGFWFHRSDHSVVEAHNGVGGAERPAATGEVEAVHQQVEARTRSRLEEPHASKPGAAYGLEDADQQRRRTPDLVRLRSDLERLAELGAMADEHVAHIGPSQLRRCLAPEARVVGHELRRPAGEDESEDPGEQPQLHDTSHGSVLPAAQDVTDRAFGLPVIGHGADEVGIEVVRRPRMATHPVSEGATFVEVRHRRCAMPGDKAGF